MITVNCVLQYLQEARTYKQDLTYFTKQLTKAEHR